MRIAVCEDNNIVAAFMEDYIASMEAENIEYEIFTSGDDLIHYMEQENVTFNILFMDIEMPGRNGIETSAYVREKDKNALIIFITDHKEYVYEVFDVLPFRFLILQSKFSFLSKIKLSCRLPLMKLFILREIYEKFGS